MPLSVNRRDGIFVLLATGLVLLYIFAAGTGFPLDDSWIHQTYGRNLGLHGQWAFILGEPSAASTSPLYTVLLSLGYLLRIPYLWWTHGLGILALSLTAMLSARMAERLLPQSKNAGWWAGLALIFTWHLIWAAASGMETMLFAFLAFALVFLAWREMDNLSNKNSHLALRGIFFGFVTALCTLARPEGIVMGGIAALLMLILRPQGKFQYLLIFGIGAAIGFSLTIAPYLWLNLQLTGGLLPNTANAKFEQHAILLELPYFQRFFDLAMAIFAGGQILLLPSIVAYLIFLKDREKVLERLYLLLPLLWALAHLTIYAARLPATYQHGRYVLPTLPAFVFTGTVGLLWLLGLPIIRKSLLLRLGLRVLAISTIVVMLAFVFVGMNAYKADVAVINSEMVASAEYISANIPDDELLAIHDIGAVGYFAPRQMIDIAGLVSPELIPIVANPDALWQYLEESGAVYLMAFPDQIPNNNPDDPRLCRIFYTNSTITEQLRGVGQSMSIYRLDWDENCEN